MSDQLECTECGQPALGEYEGEPSCGAPICEYHIQLGLDFIAAHQDGS